MYSKLVQKWHKSKFANNFKKNRFNFIFNSLINEDIENMPHTIKLLDVGCSNGKDLLGFLLNNEKFDLYGIDINDYKIDATNFKFVKGDAESIDFPDKYFDITISMGVLEHIQPVEKLCKVISEINRVSKSYYVMIPSIGTLFEPHVGSIMWQIKDHNKKKKHSSLNYYSDEAWLQFSGFKNAVTRRKYYIPLVKQDLWIYKRINQASEL